MGPGRGHHPAATMHAARRGGHGSGCGSGVGPRFRSQLCHMFAQVSECARKAAGRTLNCADFSHESIARQILLAASACNGSERAASRADLARQARPRRPAPPNVTGLAGTGHAGSPTVPAGSPTVPAASTNGWPAPAARIWGPGWATTSSAATYRYCLPPRVTTWYSARTSSPGPVTAM